MRNRDLYRPRPRDGCENLRVRTYADLPGTEVWTYECDNGGNYVMAFGGKRTEPDFHERYKDPADREHRIEQYLKGQRLRAEDKAQRMKDRYAPHGFEPGQLFMESWGYDQTNIDYYMLTELKGKTMGYIVPIASKVFTDDDAGRSQLKVGPDPKQIRDWDVLLGVDKNDGEPGKWKKLTKDGFSMGRGHTATPCDEDDTRYETAPGWGH